MKTVKLMMAFVLTIALGASSFAQMNHSSMNMGKSETMVMPKTESIKVLGKCEMCKTRIEKAAKVEGVTKADWDSKTQLLTLVYDPAKVKSDDIQKKIAAVGHDTEKYKATDKSYEGLPGCCKYERKK
jgi:mercuric ion binding protein